ncbi:MAG: ankyrin repeat domain-containing protein, partial [Planctomycetota bacterium]|nr:ankyrin repeat domain-containing protein [Planctomycetota bacterium]
DWRGVTPLHMAVRSRSVAACEVLLAAGAETNAADGGRGSTPLRRAVANTGAGGTKGRTAEALAIAKLLLEHGADPKARDARGRTLERSAQGAAMRKVLRSAKKRA